jgi:hypothetical protein
VEWGERGDGEVEWSVIEDIWGTGEVEWDEEEVKWGEGARV